MTITASCHCGKNTFRVEGEIPEQLTRCTCSFCVKSGPLRAYYAPEQFHVTSSTDGDAIYRWQSKMVAHHFCAGCGVYTYSDSPAFEMDGKWDGVTRSIGLNARLIDNFDAAEAPVTVIDGKNLW